MTLAVCLLQGAGTHALYCCIASLCRNRGNPIPLHDWLGAAFNSPTHFSRGWCSHGDDEGMTGHKCTGHARWGTHFGPSTLLTLLWQQHVAFLHVCKSHPQELLVFCYSVTLLWSVLSITTDFATEAQIWVQGKYGKYKRGGQKLPETRSCGGSSEQYPHFQTGDGRGQGSVPGAFLLQGSSWPADITGNEYNSSCSRKGNQLGIKVLVLCQWKRRGKKKMKKEEGWLENTHKIEKWMGLVAKSGSSQWLEYPHSR